MRVLIVEDDPLLGDAIATGLKQRGFEADWVPDVRDAQAAIRVEPFAAVVLDLGLPGLGGLELLRSARARGNKVPVNDGRGAFVSGDAGLLAILFTNVIDNAIRYSAPGTKVDVDMEVTAADVSVTVRDAGPGIPAEQRANVGRRFYRLPGTRAPGSGLGLSIVQRILDLHRGTIRLDTPAANIGLQVTIALPRVVG